MVVIRINGNIHPERAEIILEGIHNQARAGVIVVPQCCEVLHNDQDDEDPKIVYEYEPARVKELEAELAAAMEYINAYKCCETCKHEMTQDVADECPVDCEHCSGGPCKGICKTCYNGSKWEWRYAK